MKNIIIVLLIGIIGVTAVRAWGYDVPYREYYVAGGFYIIRFTDPDNGATCWVSKYGYSGGISCIK